MKLYDYFRSTASYRVRIALAIKNISYTLLPVHLTNHGGEQHHPDYVRLNPQELVPTLDDQGQIITQSLAIIEYLDEMHPLPPLLPASPVARAQVRSLALIIACDMHPVNNLRVLNQLRSQLHTDEQQISSWYHHWLKKGFDAFEKRLQTLPRSTDVCYGNEVSMADICLVPQIYNARRFKFSMAAYPLITAIESRCLTLAAFKNSAPVSES